MFRQHAFSRAPCSVPDSEPQIPSFSILRRRCLAPDAVPGLAAWWRLGVGVTVTGAGVSQWNDQSGNARHLLQAVDANRPPQQADGSIQFDGVSDYLQTGAFVLNQPYTIYLRMKQIAWVAGNFITDGIVNASSIKPGGTTPELRINSGLTFAGVNNVALGVVSTFVGVFNGASSRVQWASNAPVVGDASTVGLDGLTLGASRVPSLYSNIQVYDVALFNTAHGDDLARAISRYMNGFQ
jgi:hypothetical protein